MSNFLLLLGLSICMGFLSAYFARDYRNRPFQMWFIFGFLFGLASFIVLLILPKKKEEEKQVKAPKSLKKAEPTFTVDLTPKLPMKDQLWYYLDENNDQVGPMSFLALSDLLNSGAIKPGSFVWNALMKEWQPLKTLPEYLNEMQFEPEPQTT